MGEIAYVLPSFSVKSGWVAFCQKALPVLQRITQDKAIQNAVVFIIVFTPAMMVLVPWLDRSVPSSWFDGLGGYPEFFEFFVQSVINSLWYLRSPTATMIMLFFITLHRILLLPGQVFMHLLLLPLLLLLDYRPVDPNGYPVAHFEFLGYYSGLQLVSVYTAALLMCVVGWRKFILFLFSLRFRLLGEGSGRGVAEQKTRPLLDCIGSLLLKIAAFHIAITVVLAFSLGIAVGIVGFTGVHILDPISPVVYPLLGLHNAFGAFDEIGEWLVFQDVGNWISNNISKDVPVVFLFSPFSLAIGIGPACSMLIISVVVLSMFNGTYRVSSKVITIGWLVLAVSSYVLGFVLVEAGFDAVRFHVYIGMAFYLAFTTGMWHRTSKKLRRGTAANGD